MDATAHQFLDGFTPEARERLLGAMIYVDYPDGTYLFHQGDAADGVYLVLDGGVDIIRSAGAQERTLGTIPPGDFFGEVAVLDGLGRSTSARAHGATAIAKIPGDILLEVLAAGPGARTLGLVQHVLEHLRNATDLYVHEVVHKEKLSLVGEMASSLMHDLRTPVTGIRLSADLISLTAPTGKVPQWCDGIRLQCDRLVGMAVELMEFSRGEFTLALALTSISAFFDQFKGLNEASLHPPGMEIQFEPGPGDIKIDAMRMHRVLQNLVNNAIEALHATPKPRVEIKGWIENATFYLTVKDNGPGIPEAIQERIFEPFVTHGKAKGTGLGMAIVKNIVTAHGGTITFETAPKKGTSFLVSLPQKSA